MSVEPRTADELTRVIRAWLDADDSTHWGDFEKALDSIINPSENRVAKLELLQGDGFIAQADSILEGNKGEFVKLVIVGERPDGSYAVAGSHGAPEAVLLLQWGSHFLVTGKVVRS